MKDNIIKNNEHKRTQRRDKDFFHVGAIKGKGSNRLESPGKYAPPEESLITEEYLLSEIQKIVNIVEELPLSGALILSTVEELRDSEEHELTRTCIIKDINGIYYYNGDSMGADDGYNYIKPDSVSGTGRWVLQKRFANYNKIQNVDGSSYMTIDDTGYAELVTELEDGEDLVLEIRNTLLDTLISVYNKGISIGKESNDEQLDIANTVRFEGKRTIPHTITNNLILDKGSYFIYVDASTNSVITLPTSYEYEGQEYVVTVLDDTNIVLLNTPDEFEDGTSSYQLSEGQVCKIVYHNNIWYFLINTI